MRRQLLITSALLVCAAAANAQEAILLRVGGQEGQANRYQTVMDVFGGGPRMMQNMPAADTTQPTFRTTLFSTRTLTSITGDTLTFTETVDSARAESPAMPQMSAMMGNMANFVRGRITTTKMDGRARVFSMDVSNANGGGGMGSGGPGGPGGMGGGPGGRGGRGGMAGAGGNQRAMFVLPERAVRVGETWSDSTVYPGAGNDGPTSFLASFKLDRVDNRGGARVAVISMDGNMATSSATGPQRMSVRGQIQFDMTNNRLAQLDMTSSGTANMQGQEVPVRMVMTQSLIP